MRRHTSMRLNFCVLTQHGKLHKILQKHHFCLSISFFFGTLQINNLAPPGRRPRRRWAVHHLQVHMFRRRAGQGGNVSLLDQDNVVLNQINITTLLLLSGEFTPRINSYRNQRFSYKHSRHLICLMQRNILLFLFLF